MTDLLIVSVGGLAILCALLGVYALRTRHVRPNEVLLISGRKVRNPATGAVENYRIITSGRAFVWPGIEQAQALSLEIMSVPIAQQVTALSGGAVKLTGAAQIKIASDVPALRLAAERFLSKTPAEIVALTRETLAGHAAMIAGTHSVDDLRADPAAFARHLREVYAADLARMGLVVEALVIQSVQPVSLPA